ncbi:glycosyltransferase family 4 protein [Leptolyngbya iicbica]|uniref:Glycosyltransferase n=2 Tax=Cyanophyceae TaxID=3028117 RepID=A0A4Q7EDJ4_9CYAN|nr:glycosyltransferase family 4 protein [Leptolyngbya sp. LK]RZM79295.1 glycosyltransferase [Leptolyngbya sp. LK]
MPVKVQGEGELNIKKDNLTIHNKIWPSKVSIIVGDLSAEGAGRWGGAVRPFLLATALRQLGIAVEILGFTNDNIPLSIAPEVTIKRFPQTQYPRFLNSARCLIQAIEGDIIYAYKTKASSFGVGLLAKKWYKKPLILDIDDWEMSWHGGDQWRYQPSFRQRYRDLVKPNGALRQPDNPVYLKQMEKRISQADAVTVHTSFLQYKFGGICIPNGKNIHQFNPEKYDSASSRQQFGLEDYKVLMFPGAPRPYKGLEDLLIALEILKQPNLRLVIVGGSPYDDYDQQLHERWGQYIIQLPKLSYEEMPRIVSAADIIVVPQRDTAAAQAQFPLKLTDGMAMAKPILATSVGDIPVILGDTGYIVPPGDSKAMAHKIAEILNNPEAARHKGYRARERCIQHYSIDAMATSLSAQVLHLTGAEKF